MSEKMNASQVIIVPWSESDFELLRLSNAPEMMEHLGGPETEEQLRTRHNRYLTLREREKGHMFSIVMLPNRETVGSIGYWDSHWQGENVYEIGWSVLPTFQGRGIASSALQAAISHVNAGAKYRWMHAFPSIHNPASNAVCRKLSFTLRSECEFEYPPGHFMQCNDWRLELAGS
ncbi:GNAT family N-acetyltransferase [Paenibacillus qinlingensis]|uniref:RimJ/RimL family protein N-acetyltransferase n=1 Tax=Paenibacillus qinlingensis TaxID=1837343 RepID=A0ABU1P268_9BACL|nr:GNAT family N-acetyltransferase [Paenibacillus qinlingensis]MDR6553835.1 RimJ/RimL family protein N-acetyltransferase [Paenibacillus qinlingensis]